MTKNKDHLNLNGSISTPSLHYDQEKDAAFCFTCISTQKKGLISSTSRVDESFTEVGFTNWKKALEKGK